MPFKFLVKDRGADREVIPQKIAEEEAADFKQKQRRRSSLAVCQIVVDKGRRSSTLSNESYCKQNLYYHPALPALDVVQLVVSLTYKSFILLSKAHILRNVSIPI